MFELRRYTLHPGALEAMKERFRTLSLAVFEDVGITLEDAWIGCGDSETFLFLVSFPNLEARERAWERYHADERYLAARESQSQIIQDIEVTLLDRWAPGEDR
jgi:hypothetical protein